ncbi:hypothetical protein EJB05_11641, partial [Eragrostis curvula]
MAPLDKYYNLIIDALNSGGKDAKYEGGEPSYPLNRLTERRWDDHYHGIIQGYHEYLKGIIGKG